jgi:nondiscriminating glutamyl-tRNA synthetase
MGAQPLKTRFAPSPTGLLHLGNVRTALFNYLLARGGGGRFLLRIEDTDVTRGHDKYVQALQQDLTWLGLEWQEGVGAGGPHGPYLQSQRSAIYEDLFGALQASRQAYPCFCTARELEIERKAQLAAGRPPRYSGRCYQLSDDERAARLQADTSATLRFHVAADVTVEFEDRVRGPQRFATNDIGDFVIRRSSGGAAFFFSNAVDDALMGVTLVVRGDDHLSNTPRQILILRALGLPVPAYGHIALVVAEDGAPLSKREGSSTIRELREQGYLPQALNNYLARLGHTSYDDAIMDLAGLAVDFDLTRVSRSPTRFDEGHLRHWQREAVNAALPAELWLWLDDAVETWVPPDERQIFAEVVRTNINFPVDAKEWAQVIFSDQDFVLTDGARQVLANVAPSYFDQVLEVYTACAGKFEDFSQKLQARTGKKGAAALRPVRLALTNRERGPELVRLLEIMPADRIHQRLHAAKIIAEQSTQ